MAAAGIGQGVTERVVLRRPARMREPPPTQRALSYLTKWRTPRESELGDAIVNASKIVVALQHAEADHLTETILKRGSNASRSRRASPIRVHYAGENSSWLRSGAQHTPDRNSAGGMSAKLLCGRRWL